MSVESVETLDLLKPEEAANLLRLSPRTLEHHRYLGTGAPYVKLGRRCFYKRADLIEFIEAGAPSAGEFKEAG